VHRTRGHLLFIVLLGLLFFSDLVLHPEQTLYSDYSDLLTLHLPSKHFLVRSWQQTGEVPLWCPFEFAGMPFIHDVQSSAFYPLHFPLYRMPERLLGAALSWLVVFHVIAAGIAMLFYADSHGLKGAAAVAAAVGYMLAGKWLLHLLAGGHYNMAPLAWLPLVLLWLEQAIHSSSLVRATWAGAAYALMVLGAYPYVTLYAGIFIALWTLGATLNEAGFLDGNGERSWRRTAEAVTRWAGLGAWTLLVAIGLGAVQLLPSLEAAREASRSLGVSANSEAFTDGLHSVVGLIGPPLTANPDSLWENRVGVGVLWLASAVLGVVVGGKRARYEALVCGVLFLFAAGGCLLLQGLPGFRLFQLPSRILLLLALPIALFAGRATKVILAGEAPWQIDIVRCRTIFLKVCLVCLVLLGSYAAALRLKGEALQFHPYWLSLIITLPLAWCVLHPGTRWSGRRPALLWLSLLLADLWAFGRPLVAVRPEAEIYTASNCVRFLADARGDGGRVLDFEPPGFSANATPLWPGMSTIWEIESLRGFNPVDVLRYKRYLEFMTDRDDALRPLDRMFTSAVLGTFPVRNQGLANVLGVRYLLQPARVPLEATVPDPKAREVWKKVEQDTSPRTFNFIPYGRTGEDCGLRRLPPYVLYENRDAFPRAFVVPRAKPLNEGRQLLRTLSSTDFRETVLLSDDESRTRSAGVPKSFRAAPVIQYQPNFVEVDVQDAGEGYLVLADIWFPGWTCEVDGHPVQVHRANYLFRAVELPRGSRHVVFRFALASYRYGKALSLAFLAGAFAVTLCFCFSGRGRTGRSQTEEVRTER
jgi:hypothetical protein